LQVSTVHFVVAMENTTNQPFLMSKQKDFSAKSKPNICKWYLCENLW